MELMKYKAPEQLDSYQSKPFWETNV